MGAPHVEVMQVPHGSIIWMHNVVLEHGDDALPNVFDQIARKVGHDDFVVIETEGDTAAVRIVGPEQVAELAALLTAADNAVRTCRKCGCTDERACEGGSTGRRRSRQPVLGVRGYRWMNPSSRRESLTAPDAST